MITVLALATNRAFVSWPGFHRSDSQGMRFRSLPTLRANLKLIHVLLMKQVGGM
jgi:hypothetical protein